MRFDWVAREVEMTAWQNRVGLSYFDFNKDFIKYEGTMAILATAYDHLNARFLSSG
jgi:hypothetical protein